MSTSGIYNYRPKVEHPNSVLPQMTSDGFLPPVFFGGSQVPSNLGIINGSGIKRDYVNSFDIKDAKNLIGRGIHTSYEHTNKIMFPKHYKRI